ncbi:MAG: phosphate ABC transporter substrate-binding protein PstS [Neisseriaceae bacterium]|nr:phosphate ABC transporter substrate-binding protein PstS [Neisseriaceae bacterium]
MQVLTRTALGLSLALLSGSLLAANITGAGASFPQPVYAQWAQAYKKETGHQVNYQSIGSSGGVKQIQSKTVDFGATDAPLTSAELKAAGLVQFPTVIGGVVPIVNIDGIKPGQLKMTGDLLANIYLGKITKWNDPAITKLNPGLKLPDAKITTVFRSDGSGTTFNFTNYLSKTSADWQKTVGAANSVKWPTATSGAAGKGNEGVAVYVRRVKNAIGYVEYAYAKQNKMSHTAMKNKAGNFVQPSEATFKAAANTDWAKASDFHLILTDQAGAQAWPIAAATFILMQKNAVNSEQSKETLKFFDWAYKKGDAAARQLDYVAMPESTKTLIRKSWKNITADGKAVY